MCVCVCVCACVCARVRARVCVCGGGSQQHFEARHRHHHHHVCVDHRAGMQAKARHQGPQPLPHVWKPTPSYSPRVPPSRFVTKCNLRFPLQVAAAAAAWRQPGALRCGPGATSNPVHARSDVQEHPLVLLEHAAFGPGHHMLLSRSLHMPFTGGRCCSSLGPAWRVTLRPWGRQPRSTGSTMLVT